MKFSRQTTLRSQATVTGVGVHSGLARQLSPSDLHHVDAGFIFVRTGLEGADREVPAHRRIRDRHRIRHRAGRPRTARWSRPPSMCSPRCAAWASTTPPSKSTAPKFRSWTAAPRRSSPRSIRPASSTQSASRRFIQVLKPVQVALGAVVRRNAAACAGFRAEVEIDFANPMIGRQSYSARSQPRRRSAAKSAAPAPSAA